MREDEPHTSVVVPSLTLDQSELRKLAGASFYEERLLFLLIRLRNPRARMVYVTSQPVHPIILEYYLQFLAGIPASHARARLTLLCAYDASPRSLTEKILERPRLIERIRAGIHDPSTRLPDRLQLDAARAQARGAARHPAERLRPAARPPRHEVGQPQGVPARPASTCPRASRTCTRRARSRRRSMELRARRPRHAPRGDQARTRASPARATRSCATRSRPRARPARGAAAGRVRRCRRRRPRRYFDKFSRMGGIVEEFIEAEEKLSPSAQLRIEPARRGAADLDPRPDPRRAERPGVPGLPFPGARRLPPLRSRTPALRVGQVLARHGVVSRFGVDFLVYRDQASQDVEDHRARDQPAHGRHDAPVPRAAVPDRRRSSIPTRACSSRRAATPSTTGPPTTSTRTTTAACCRRT